MAQFANMFEVDLNNRFYPVSLVQTVSEGNVYANRIGAYVYKDGAPVNLGGACTGLVMRADGTTVPLTGYVEGNAAYVVLDQPSCAIPGPIQVAINSVVGENITTLLVAYGTVIQTDTRNYVEPGTPIPDITELLAEIDNMREATAEAEAAAEKSVRYDTAQSLTNAQKVQARSNIDAANATLTGSVSYHYGFLPGDPRRDYLSARAVWSLNRINDETGADVDNGTLSRTDTYIEIKDINAPVMYGIKNTSDEYALALYYYDADKDFLGLYETSYHAGDYTGQFYALDPETRYIRLSAYKRNTTVFASIDDVLDHVEVYQYVRNIDLHDVSWSIGVGLTCNTDLSGFYSKGYARYATSDYIPVGKGSEINTCHLLPNVTGPYAVDLIYVYTFDADYNLTGYMNPDSWSSHWEAAQDCYIRIIARYSSSDDMTSEILNALLYRVTMYRTQPVDTAYTFRVSSSNKPALSEFLLGVSLDSMVQRSRNEDEFGYNARMTSWYFPVGKGTIVSMGIAKELSSDVITKLALYQYDKNFVWKGESYNWCCDDIVKQDGYIRIIMRRTSNSPLTSEDAAWLYNHLTVKYVQPTDADLLEPVDVRREKAMQTTMNMIYGNRLTEVQTEYTGLGEPGRLGYVWISDIHIDDKPYRKTYKEIIQKRVFNAVREAAEMNNLDFICVGGDLFDLADTEVGAYELIASVMEPLKNSTVPVIVLFGNHDNNVYGLWDSARYSVEIPFDNAVAMVARRSKFYNQIQFADASAGYFYFDIPAKHKRIVCLNGNDPEGTAHTSGWWCINQAQVEWFCETASDTENDIIILTHTPPGTKYEFYGYGNEGGYYTDLANAITAYNARTSITLYGTTYDFSSAEGRVKLIHCGHTHFELDPTIEPYTWGGVPVIVTSCAKAWAQTGIRNEATEVTSGSDLWYYTQAQAAEARANAYCYKFYCWTDRKYWTINEALFDVVSVGTDAAKCLRVGAGIDREYEL